MSEVELDILIDHYTKKTKKDMFEYIERKTGYTKDELTSSCRKQELCLVRHAHWYLLRKSRKITLEGIGGIYGRKHSTIFYRNKKD